jgi:hypothetical protein
VSSVEWDVQPAARTCVGTIAIHGSHTDAEAGLVLTLTWDTWQLPPPLAARMGSSDTVKPPRAEMVALLSVALNVLLAIGLAIGAVTMMNLSDRVDATAKQASVPGPPGPKGPPGPAGQDGEDGKDGEDGDVCSLGAPTIVRVLTDVRLDDFGSFPSLRESTQTIYVCAP